MPTVFGKPLLPSPTDKYPPGFWVDKVIGDMTFEHHLLLLEVAKAEAKRKGTYRDAMPAWIPRPRSNLMYAHTN